LIGGYQRCWSGYRSSRQTLFEMANIMLANNHHEITPYLSPLAQKPEYREREIA
jgi:nitrogenase molybdenum-iron protein NifN